MTVATDEINRCLSVLPMNHFDLEAVARGMKELEKYRTFGALDGASTDERSAQEMALSGCSYSKLAKILATKTAIGESI